VEADKPLSLVNILGGYGRNVGLCAADMPAAFVKSPPFGVALGGYNCLVFGKGDCAFSFAAQFRPLLLGQIGAMQPLHVQRRSPGLRKRSPSSRAEYCRVKKAPLIEERG